jgi:hypothetical protein
MSLYRYIGNLCTTGNDAMGLAGQQCSIHMFYGDNAEIWDMMYEVGLLKTKKPMDQDNYPDPTKDDWNIPDNTWINPYFCWESRFCRGVDNSRLVRILLKKGTREYVDTVNTVRNGGFTNKHKIRELCRQKICCSVTVYMYCGDTFFVGLEDSIKREKKLIDIIFPIKKNDIKSKENNEREHDEFNKFVENIRNFCIYSQIFFCDELK